ncbi:MAG: hypothetical protein LBV47_08735 [Bacteroidales bacterium]|nr:hypothetical protein [Bacteroidales bacterium]
MYRLWILILAVVFAACQKDIIENEGITINSEEIVVVDNTIKSPQWLINVLDDIAHKYQPSPETGEYPYPWVYSVKHKNQGYVLVSDMLESCWTCGQLFFTLSGKPIEYSSTDDLFSGLYYELSMEENRTLLWRQHYSSPETKAFTGLEIEELKKSYVNIQIK